MKKLVIVSLFLITLVIVGVVVFAQGQEPVTDRDGVAGGGGERTGNDYSVTDVIGLPAVGHSTGGSVDLFAGLVWLGGAQPSVTTDAVTGLTSHSGTLNGTLHDLGTADTVDVHFEWDIDSGIPYAYDTGTISMTGTGSFTIPISGLLDNQTYYYRAKAEGDGYDDGSVKSFKTLNAPNVIYVDSMANGSENGTSWGDAYRSLQAGLARADSGDEIWVVSGVYTPGNDRTDTFMIKQDVGIYGGFVGMEGARSERNWYVNETVLSGDVGTPNYASDNCYHVVSGSGVGNNTTILDGFTVSGGNANEAVDDRNSGGGMYVINGSPVFYNCVFEDNSAEYGGALYTDNSSPHLTNCTFWNNSAIIFDVGAGSVPSAPPIDSITMEQAMAGGWSVGGAIVNNNSNPTITNCAFSANSADLVGGIANMGASSLILKNSILWADNPDEIGGSGVVTVTYSDIEGGRPGIGNIDQDPLWANPGSGDFHLQTNSPCVDGGTIPAIPAGIAMDFEGQGRIIGSSVDMGPDEFQAIFVKRDASGDNDGSTWMDAFIDLQDALAVASNGAEIWVASGTYTPGINRTDYFQMKNGVKMYGGFSGVETDSSQRDWKINVTILSGDIGAPGVSGDNCYHVFYHPDGTNLDVTSILDGFVITGGNANSVCCEPDKRGGGMYNDASSPTITNCKFLENTASYYGGGMYNSLGSSPVLTNCIFFENNAVNRDGAGIYNNESSPDIINCTFNSNTADDYGGGIYNNNSSTVLTNCILWGNIGGELYNDNSTPIVTYSNVEGGYTGIGNIGGTPMFTNSAIGDLHLQPNSPCIDAGTNSAPNLPITDIDKDNRIIKDTVDMGADETCAHILSASSVNGGFVSAPGEGDYPYACGTAVAILAEANPCYSFVNWTGDTAEITDPDMASTTVTMNGDYSIQANFTIDQYNLILQNDAHGTTAPYEGTQSQDCGDTINIDASPDTCYVFNEWTGDIAYLNSPETQASNSVTMPQGDVNLVATFVIDQFDLTASSGIGGSITSPGEGISSYDCGDVVPIVAAASRGYSFTGWSGDISDITNPGSLNTTITMNADYSVTADFELVEITVEIYVKLQGQNRPEPQGWQVPLDVCFFPANSGTMVMSGSSSADYYFHGTTIYMVTIGGTRAMLTVGPVNPGTYDITADSATTLLNVKRNVGIW